VTGDDARLDDDELRGLARYQDGDLIRSSPGSQLTATVYNTALYN